MKPLPACILYTQDADLERRLSAFLASLATVRAVHSPAETERALQQLEPALFLVDVRSPETEDLVITCMDEHAGNVVIAVGVARSDPMRATQALGVFANEDIQADRQRMQAQVKRGLKHMRVLEENAMLRESTAATTASAAAGAPTARASARLPLPYFSKALRNMANVEALLEGIVEGIASSMLVSRVGIFARAAEQGVFRLRAGIRHLRESEDLEYTERDPLVSWLEVNAHMVSRDNLSHIPDVADRHLLKQALETLGAEILIPMLARGRIIGWLFVGHRSTGLPFEYLDLEDLVAVTEHSTTILENALLYEEIAAQKTLAETVLQSMPTGIVAVGPAGRVRSFNNAAHHILEVDAADALNQPIECLGSALADLMRRTLEGNGDVTPREWTDVKNGRALSARARRLTDGTNDLGAVALVQDLSAEKLLHEKEDQLERAAFWTDLAASMSHEVRNPLVAIKTFAQLLPERYEDPEFRSEFSKLVSLEVDRLNKIIEQINDFAHPPDLEFKPVDIDATIRKSVDMATLRMPRNGISVDANLAKNLPDLDGDARALAECFAEVITNAMEASLKRKKPQVHIEAATTTTPNGNGPDVTVTVKDNGEGIAAEIEEKVFSPFCTTKARGMGLGLPIARRTVIDHSGRIDIHTGKKGTEVTIALPSGHEDGAEATEA